jgi:exodeoxyribonuclease VII small subunit
LGVRVRVRVVDNAGCFGYSQTITGRYEGTMKNFEERLSRLEELGALVKKNDVPLDKALLAFEEGMKLSRSLEAEIAKIENRVEMLTNGPEVSPNSMNAAEGAEEKPGKSAGTPDEAPALELFALGGANHGAN